MGKRVRKPPVKPEVRRKWLKRYEEEGESPPQIADKDGFDVRTVRKQIQEAQRDREIREGRLMVLRNAIEEHHRDLVNFAQQLDSRIAGEAMITAELRSAPMWLALRQHLPRSPLWKGFDKWDKLLQKTDGLRKNIKAKLEKKLTANSKLRDISALRSSGVIPGMVAALAFQMEQWARGKDGLSTENSFHIKLYKDDLVKIEYGPFNMWPVVKKLVPELKAIIIAWETEVKTWQEYYDMEKMIQDLIRANQKLRDELTTIILRRIVPGKCKYCPA
ncbi:MAG: hypothetical protein JRF50_17365 [Deltaproteobacteria bacterium]|nr:hypothetical protein [Deltaproteobacteria bacterium]